MGLEERIQLIEDKLAIKQLVDTYSIMMDEKNGMALKNMFIPDAVMKNYIGDDERQTLSGADQIATAYHNYLATIDSAFHMNGQQVLNVMGERALGRSYCRATIVETKNGTTVTTLQNIYYDDEFRKIDGRWFFAKRNCHYVNLSSK